MDLFNNRLHRINVRNRNNAEKALLLLCNRQIIYKDEYCDMLRDDFTFDEINKRHMIYKRYYLCWDESYSIDLVYKMNGDIIWRCDQYR